MDDISESKMVNPECHDMYGNHESTNDFPQLSLEEQNLILDLYSNQKISVREINKKVKRRGALIYEFLKHKNFVFSQYRIPIETENKVIDLLKKRVPYIEIMNICNVSRNTVWKIKKTHLGINNFNSIQISDPLADEILNLYSMGNSEQTIATQLNLERSKVRRFLIKKINISSKDTIPKPIESTEEHTQKEHDKNMESIQMLLDRVESLEEQIKIITHHLMGVQNDTNITD